MAAMKRKGISLLVGSVAVLAVAGVAQAETRFAVQDSTGTVDKMVVTDSGYVGVGTNAPTNPVQVKGGSLKDVTVDINYAGNATYNKFNAPTIQFTRNNLASQNGGLPQATDRLGFMNFGTLINGSFVQGAQMNAIAETGTWTATSHPAAFTFSTSPADSQYAVERIRINGAGNVGVGTSSPTQRLEVNGGVRLNSTTAKPACTTANRGTLWFNQGTTDTLEVCAQVNGGTPIWRTVTLQ